VNVFDRYQRREAQADASGPPDTWVEELYARYKDRLLRVILGRLWRGQTSPETVIQDVFLSVARRPDASGLKDDELRRLLFGIALRHCNNANHRTKWARDHGHIPEQLGRPGDEPGTGYDPPDKGESALEWLEQQDWVERIRSRLVTMGFNERELHLFDLMLDGHTIEEMAAATGLRVGWVRDRRARILRVVKACYEEGRHEPGEA
jgi:DNA-directed RNA polymerase specialized sigma24 family protein